MNWPLGRVREMVDLINGYPFDSALFGNDGTMPLVRIRDINASVFETYISGHVPDYVKLRDGDLVIGMDGDFNICLWSRGEAALNQRLCALRPKIDTDIRWLKYNLPPELTYINETQYATTVKHLSSSEVLGIRFYRPDYLEQVLICDFLDREAGKIDALIDKQHQLIATLREDRTATITHAVTKGLNPNVEMIELRKTWSDQSPITWAARRLGRDVVIQTGFAFPSESFIDNGTPIIRISDIGTDGVVSLKQAKHVPIEFRDSHRHYLAQAGEIVMAMTGATLGKPGILTPGDKALLNQRTCSLSGRRESLTNKFLWYLISSRPFQEHLSLTAFGGAQANISDTEIVGVTAVLPGIEEQRSIAVYLDDQCAKIDMLIAQSNQMVGSLTEYRSALIGCSRSRVR